MERLRFFEQGNKNILEINYARLSEQEMIDLITEAAAWVKRKNVPIYVVAIHERNYIRPGFVHHAKSVTGEILHLIRKMAFVGLTPTQSLILKGYSIFFRKNFKVFATYDEAMHYLLNNTTTDDDLPEYYKNLKK